MAGCKRSWTGSAEAKYDGQSLQEAKIADSLKSISCVSFEQQGSEVHCFDYLYTLFSTIYTSGNNVCDQFAFLDNEGSTLKGKNLLLKEQILSFKVDLELIRGKTENDRLVKVKIAV